MAEAFFHVFVVFIVASSFAAVIRGMVVRAFPRSVRRRSGEGKVLLGRAWRRKDTRGCLSEEKEFCRKWRL